MFFCCIRLPGTSGASEYRVPLVHQSTTCLWSIRIPRTFDATEHRLPLIHRRYAVLWYILVTFRYVREALQYYEPLQYCSIQDVLRQVTLVGTVLPRYLGTASGTPLCFARRAAPQRHLGPGGHSTTVDLQRTLVAPWYLVMTGIPWNSETTSQAFGTCLATRVPYTFQVPW